MNEKNTNAKNYFTSIKNYTGIVENNQLNFDYSDCSPAIIKIIKKLEEFSDILTVEDFRQVTGQSEKLVFRLIKNGKLKSFNLHQQLRIIPRIWALEYITSIDFLNYIKNRTGGKNNENK